MRALRTLRTLRPPRSEPLPYRALWQREVTAGLYGQDMARTSTWRLDHLWRAACWQASAEEQEQFLAEAMTAGVHPDTVAGMLEHLEAAREKAHRVFLDGEAQRQTLQAEGPHVA